MSATVERVYVSLCAADTSGRRSKNKPSTPRRGLVSVIVGIADSLASGLFDDGAFAARVSSVGQSLDIQREKLEHCDKLFEEKLSGTTGKRPRLQARLEYVHEGDTLIVTKLDRLARSPLDLRQIAAELERKGVHLRALGQNINTCDATGRLLFNMLGAIAQFETEIRAERQREGIAKAQARAVRFGAQSKLDKHRPEIEALLANGSTQRFIAKRFDTTEANLSRWLKKHGLRRRQPACFAHIYGRIWPIP